MSFTISVPKGVRYSDLSATFGFNEQELRELNPGASELTEGQTIVLPISDDYEKAIGYVRPDPAVHAEVSKQRTKAPDIFDDIDARDKQMRDRELDATPKPSENWYRHLHSREGYRDKVYLDSLGKPTVGMGIYVPDMQEGDEVDPAWLEQETKKRTMGAWQAAVAQGNDLGVKDQDFLEGLASVNYQLGNDWNKIHKKTWALMQQGKWNEAADEAANSKWNEQTPVRVRDFQQVLRSRG